MAQNNHWVSGAPGQGGPTRGPATGSARCTATARLATGESVIKCPSPLNVLKATHDHSCYWARSDEYQRLMIDSLRATARPAAGRSATRAPHPGIFPWRCCVEHTQGCVMMASWPVARHDGRLGHSRTDRWAAPPRPARPGRVYDGISLMIPRQAYHATQCMV